MSAILTNSGEIETKRNDQARAIAYLEGASWVIQSMGNKARGAHSLKDLADSGKTDLSLPYLNMDLVALPYRKEIRNWLKNWPTTALPY